MGQNSPMNWIGYRVLVLGLTLVGLAVPGFGQSAPKPMMEAQVRAAGGRQIGGPDLLQMLVGNSQYLMFLRSVGNSKVGDVILIYYPDQRTRIVRWPGGYSYKSNIWLEGDALCVEQRGGTGAGHQCYSSWVLGDTTYQCALPAGDCLLTSRVVPGNTERL